MKERRAPAEPPFYQYDTERRKADRASAREAQRAAYEPPKPDGPAELPVPPEPPPVIAPKKKAGSKAPGKPRSKAKRKK